MTKEQIIQALNKIEGWVANLWEKKNKDGNVYISRIYLNVHKAGRGYIETLNIIKNDIDLSKIACHYRGDVRKALSI